MRPLAPLLALALSLALEPARAEPVRLPSIILRVDGSGADEDEAWLAVALARSSALGAVIPYQGPASGLAEAAARARCELIVEASTELLEAGEARSAWRVSAARRTASSDASPESSDSQGVRAEGVIEGPAPTERDAATFWWLPLVAATERAAQGLSLGDAAVLKIEGPPGASVSFRPGSPGTARLAVELSAEGNAELPVEPPVTLRWRALAGGAFPASGIATVLADGQALTIPVRPLRRLALELGAQAFQYPDAYAALGLLDSYLWLGAGLGQYALGLSLRDARDEAPNPPFIASLPLFLPGLAARLYALPADATLRPYLILVAALRVYALSGSMPILEPVAPLIATANLGAEWRFADDIAAFIELGAAYYPLADGLALAASRGGSDSGYSAQVYGDDWLVEFPPPRIGIRVYIW